MKNKPILRNSTVVKTGTVNITNFKHEDKGEHYRFMYRGIKLDPARIIMIYDAKHPMQQAIIKKSLCTGNRGKKSLVDDIKDIITAAERWLEMIEEDAQ